MNYITMRPGEKKFSNGLSISAMRMGFHTLKVSFQFQKNSALYFNLNRKTDQRVEISCCLSYLADVIMCKQNYNAWHYGSSKFTKLRIVMHKITWKTKFK